MIEKINWEQIRLIFVSGVSPILGYFTPTKGFVYSLLIMFAFNIWAGMRADGVVIIRCKNFSMKKFRRALTEFILYLVIVEMIYSIMLNCGDAVAAIVVVKSLTYVFMYVYLQNAFKNLIIAYPKSMGLRIIYHVIRLEFVRALPSHIQPIIDRVEQEMNRQDGTRNEQTRWNKN